MHRRVFGIETEYGLTCASTVGGAPPLGPEEAAQYLGIKPRTLKKWRHERRIGFYRLGHVAVVFDVRDLDAFLARRRVEAIG